MSFIQELWGNRLLISAGAAWIAAQLLKTVLHAIMNKGIDWERLIGDGGMPSAHSATVSALAASAALHYGLGSSVFALAAILAIIVMHDARSVRRESGRHAKALNELWIFLQGEDAPEVKFREMLGHSPLQVFVGGLLGIAVAFLLR